VGKCKGLTRTRAMRKKPETKKRYKRPELIRYGRVLDLTQGATTGTNDPNGSTFGAKF